MVTAGPLIPHGRQFAGKAVGAMVIVPSWQLASRPQTTN